MIWIIMITMANIIKFNIWLLATIQVTKTSIIAFLFFSFEYVHYFVCCIGASPSAKKKTTLALVLVLDNSLNHSRFCL